MPITAAAGTSAEDQKALNLAVQYLSNSPNASYLLSLNTVVHIDHNNVDENSPSTGGVYWDPGSALQVQDANGVLGVQSAAIGLIHEIAHNQLGSSEAQATAIETAVARDLGDATRADYSKAGDYVHTDNPTEHTNNGTWTERTETGATVTGPTYNDSADPAPSLADTGYGSGYGYGYYYAGTRGNSQKSGAKGVNIDALVQFDKAHGNHADAAQATRAWAQVEAAITNNSASVVSGATWNHKDVTWNLAQSGGQFKGHMGAQEEQAIQKAFDQWSAATGLTSHEVSSSAKSDITIGWGDFDTAESGLVGLTGLFTKEGKITKATVRLENPSNDRLVGNANGERIYANTDASFDQVLLHEIGHALGLGDNVDPSSIENYSLTQANRTLSANDIATVQSLYGKGSKHAIVTQTVDHGTDGLVQAMSAFAPVPMANAVAANDDHHVAHFTYGEPMRHVR